MVFSMICPACQIVLQDGDAVCAAGQAYDEKPLARTDAECYNSDNRAERNSFK